MSESSATIVRDAIEKHGTVVHRSAQSCSGKFGAVCKALWPDKTAEHLSAKAQCGIRSAGYYIAGEREPSAAAIAAVVAEMLG